MHSSARLQYDIISFRWNGSYTKAKSRSESGAPRTICNLQSAICNPKEAAMNLLVTGGAGFIGSNFIRYWLERYPDDRVVNLDLLTYAGNVSSLSDIAAR